MAGEAYTKRYAGGFADGAGGGTPVDATFLNAVETALLRLLGEDPAADEVGVWVPASGRFVFQKVTNAQIDAAAAIDKSKLGPLNIVNADISAGAAIAKSKLAALNIVDADVSSISYAKLTGVAKAVSFGTSLPGSPADGDEAILVDSLTVPTYALRFRYVGGIGDAYKWVCIGGYPLYAAVAANENLASVSYGDLATIGPSITLPRAGIWLIEHGCRIDRVGSSNDAYGYMSYAIGGAAAVDADGAFGTFAQHDTGAHSMPNTVARKKQQTITAAATALVAKYRTSSAADTAQFGERWMTALPLRVA